MTEKRFWCLEEYEGETSPIVDGKFAPTNGWLCNRLNELYEENEQLKSSNMEMEDYLARLEEENKDLKDFIRKISTNNEIILANGTIYKIDKVIK